MNKLSDTEKWILSTTNCVSNKYSATASSSTTNVQNKPESKSVKSLLTQFNISMHNCHFCLESEVMHTDLVVSKGKKIYVILPSEESITDAHCLLVPIRHVACAALLNEEECQELTLFKNSLTKMFANLMNKTVVFFETAIYKEGYPHMQFNCVPLSRDKSALAPDIFNKVCVKSGRSLKALNGMEVRTGIPKDMNYFSISFGPSRTHAVVINDNDFPKNFAETVFEDYLGLRKCLWKEASDIQRQRVSMFLTNWYSFNPALH